MPESSNSKHSRLNLKKQKNGRSQRATRFVIELLYSAYFLAGFNSTVKCLIIGS